MQRFPLAGGCYVIPPDAPRMSAHGSWEEAWVVNRALGGDALSMLRVRARRGRSPIRTFSGSETAIFVLSGEGAIHIGDNTFAIAERDGIYVAPGEGFAFENGNDTPLELVMTICPEPAEGGWLETMPPIVRATDGDRVVSAKRQERQATGDRFYQVLIDGRTGCETITQFIGAIPLSRAPEHFHHYEETIAILAGEGFMWTGDVKAPVAPGSLIYLPRGQKHCLECTVPSGLVIAGMFYPSGSPAVRYE
jgi:mannose-6-phosphate isomerase-like protein (cupin superfamily)